MDPPPPRTNPPASREKHDIDAEFRQRLQNSITTTDPITGQRRWATNAEMNSREPNRQTNTEGKELRRRYRRGYESEEHEAVILDRLRARPGDVRRERAAFTADEFWAEHDVWVAENDASSTQWSSSSDEGDARSRERSIETWAQIQGEGDKEHGALIVGDHSPVADAGLGA
ncbi:hypothetical protein LTR95_004253 [Oleoguttula sp. CCFEE 5521]